MTNSKPKFCVGEEVKLYRPIKVKFWSLRCGLGDGLGVIFDVDTEVERTVRRVLSGSIWKWQIVDSERLRPYDYFVDVDQETLDAHGQEIELEYV